MYYEPVIHKEAKHKQRDGVLVDATPGEAPVHLPGLIAFDCVARHLNFGRAATELGVTPTAISKTVKQLEAQVTTVSGPHGTTVSITHATFTSKEQRAA